MQSTATKSIMDQYDKSLKPASIQKNTVSDLKSTEPLEDLFNLKRVSINFGSFLVHIVLLCCT